MRHVVLCSMILSVALVAAGGEEPRAVNGIAIEGKILNIHPFGLEIETPRGVFTNAWHTLSAGTRYRYEPGFRDKVGDLLAGKPLPKAVPAAAANEPAASPDEPAPSPAAAAAAAAPAKPAGGAAAKPAKPGAPAGSGMTGAQFAEKLKVKDTSTMEYGAVKFGPGDGDVIYLAFEIEGSRQEPTNLYMHRPGDEKYDTPVRSRADKEEKKPPSFRGFRCVTRTSEGPVEVSVDFVRAQKNRDKFWLGTFELQRNVRGSATTLVFRWPLKAVTDSVPVIPLNDIWSAKATLKMKTVDGDKKIGFDLKLGDDRPAYVEKGVENAVQIDVLDEKDGIVDSFKVRMDRKYLDDQNSAAAPLRRLRKETLYKIRGTIDLGPPYGRLTDEITYQSRDLK